MTSRSGTNSQVGSRSTKRLTSQGHAIRSTRAFSRVTHFMVALPVEFLVALLCNIRYIPLQPMAQWLVLLVALPPHPSSLRVRVWRKLRALGAVALKKSVYILPFTPENVEQFQWLTQEVQKARGEATLMKVDQIETMTRAEKIGRASCRE